MGKRKDRYSALAKVPDWDIGRLKKSVFLVVGAGALGNEVLKNLALLGVGKVIVIDFDQVEEGNLSRSVLFREEDAHAGVSKASIVAKRIREISPETEVDFIEGDLIQDLGWGIIDQSDVVIGCLDNRLARLSLNRYCFARGKSWVNGGILNVAGQATVYQPGRSCYECELDAKAWSEIRARLGCADIAQRYLAAGQVPTTPISASIIGAIQVQEALKLLFGQEEGSLAGRKFYYEGGPVVSGVYQTLPQKEDCLSHVKTREVVRLPSLRSDSSLIQALAILKSELKATQVAIRLRNEVATSVAGMESGNTAEILLPRLHVNNSIVKTLGWPDRNIGFPPGGLVRILDESFARPEARLARLGVAFLDQMEIQTNEGRFLVELTGDLERVKRKDGIFRVPVPDWKIFAPGREDV